MIVPSIWHYTYTTSSAIYIFKYESDFPIQNRKLDIVNGLLKSTHVYYYFYTPNGDGKWNFFFLYFVSEKEPEISSFGAGGKRTKVVFALYKNDNSGTKHQIEFPIGYEHILRTLHTLVYKKRKERFTKNEKWILRLKTA